MVKGCPTLSLCGLLINLLLMPLETINNFCLNPCCFNHLVTLVVGTCRASQILTVRCYIEGLENLPKSSTAFVTGNHYNQFDVLLMEKLALKKHQRLFIVVEASNLVMPNLIGWAVQNFDSLPIDRNLHYLSRIFPKKIKKVLQKSGWILIYPEELWFNYRKPRPLKKAHITMLPNSISRLFQLLLKFRPPLKESYFNVIFTKLKRFCMFCQLFTLILT